MKASSFNSSEPISGHSGIHSGEGVSGGNIAKLTTERGFGETERVPPSPSILDYSVQNLPRICSDYTLFKFPRASTVEEKAALKKQQRLRKAFFSLKCGVLVYGRLSDHFKKVKTKRGSWVQVRLIDGLRFVSLTSDLSHLVDASSLEAEKKRLLRDFLVWYKRVLRYHKNMYGPEWSFPYAARTIEFNQNHNLLHLHFIGACAEAAPLDYGFCVEAWTAVHNPSLKERGLKSWIKILRPYVRADVDPSDFVRVASGVVAGYVSKYVSKSDLSYNMASSYDWVFRGYKRDWTDLKHMCKVTKTDVGGRLLFSRTALKYAIAYWDRLLLRGGWGRSKPVGVERLKVEARKFARVSRVASPLLPDVSADFRSYLRGLPDRKPKRRVAPWHGFYRGPG